MKTIIAAYMVTLMVTLGLAADVPATDPWDIYEKLDPKKYEHLFPVDRSATTTTVIEFETNGLVIPLSAVTNTPPLQTSPNAGYSNSLEVHRPHRSWSIRGTKFADLHYLGIIEKDGKRLVCLAPQGLGMRAVPLSDLSEEDVRAVEAFEGSKRDGKK